MKTLHLFIAALGIAIASAALAQSSGTTVLEDIDRRPATSLNGEWHTIVDPYFAGYFNFHHEMRPDGFYRNAPLKPDSTPPVEYDFSRSPVLKVPGDWNTQSSDLFLYEGPVWYQRDFEYIPKAGHRTFLHIGAANYHSYFWVNGKKVCEHEGGFTSFDCDATEALHSGQNFLVAAVDSTRRADGIPTLEVDWWNYGGLTRDVSLVDVPDSFIDEYDLPLDRATRSSVSGWVHVVGGKPGQSVTVDVPELSTHATGAVGEDGRAPIHLELHGATLWSPESPKLYKVQLRTASDSIEDEMGFRTIETRGTEILLNGRPVFLRGISIQGEAPYRTGRATTQKDVDTLLDWAQELGCNYIRLAHYPHDQRMTRAADKRGLLVWSEIPVYWAIQFGNPEVLAKAEFQLQEEIHRDRDKASVILWSIANETPNTPERTKFLTALAGDVHRLDSSRLVTAALLLHGQGDNKLVVDDALGNALDVIGTNEYIGWYQDTPQSADRFTWQMAFDKPLIVSEFGGGAKAGLHGKDDERWTEEFQANLFRHQLGMLNKVPQLRGLSPWVLMDFRSPYRLLPGIQDRFNRKGLVSDQGKRKAAFYVLQKAYRDKSIGSATARP